MIGRTNTGGGGAGLNFSVVGGTTVPRNPKENMIWVNTAAKITSWAFSASEPEAPENGMAWVTIGTGSPVAFNALKKNGIAIYPLSAKQYRSGIWEQVTAKICQAGEWKDMLTDTVFYKNGGFNTEVFGEPTGTTNNVGGVLDWRDGYSANATKLFSVDGFDRIEIVVPSTYWGIIDVRLVDRSGGEAKYQRVGTETVADTFTVDISGMTGQYYLKLSCYAPGSSDWVRISSITFKV